MKADTSKEEVEIDPESDDAQEAVKSPHTSMSLDIRRLLVLVFGVLYCGNFRCKNVNLLIV